MRAALAAAALVVLAGGIAGAPPPASAASAGSAAAGDALPAPRLIAVKFHADWCGSCKAMGGAFEDLRDRFDGRPALFVTLDFTTTTTRHRSGLLASALGVAPAVQANPGTGFVLLIEPSGQVVTKLKGMTFKEMASAIEARLASAP